MTQADLSAVLEERERYQHLAVPQGVVAPEHRALGGDHPAWACGLCSAWRATIDQWLTAAKAEIERLDR